MGSLYQMNPVVRRIDKSERKAAEAAGAEIVEIAMGGNALFASKWYYAVGQPHGGTRGVANCSVAAEMHAPELNWRLTLNIDLRLQCGGPGQDAARQIVDALREYENPDQGIEALVRKWVENFISKEKKLDTRGFLQNYFDLRTELKKYLVKSARAEAALEITKIEIKVRNEERVPKVVEVRLPALAVVLRDYSPEVTFGLQADLRVLPTSIVPLLDGVDEELLVQQVREGMRDLMRTEVDLQVWQFDQQGRVKSKIAAALDGIAAANGRKLERLTIDATAPIAGVQRSLEVQVQREPFRKGGYPDPVEIDLTLPMELTDLGKLVASKVDPPAVEQWVRASVQTVIREHMLNITYLDLFNEFKVKIEEAKNAFAGILSSIGYSVSGAITLQTNLDFDVLERGFLCRIEKAPFQLKLPECEVVLDIETRLRITDHETLGRIFNRNVGVRQIFESEIREAVRQALSCVEPEEFYLRFRGGASAEESVEKRLVKAILSACSGYKPEMSVKIDQREDELMRLYRELTKREIVFDGLTDSNTQIVVDARCMVSAISGANWHQFQERKPSPETLASHAHDHVLSFINDCAKRNFKVLLKTRDEELRIVAEKWVNDRISNDLGLNIRIVYWYRHQKSTGGEDIDWMINQLRDTKRNLMEQLTLAYKDVGGPRDVLEDLKSRMAMVDAELQSLYDDSGRPSVVTDFESRPQLEAPAVRRQIAADGALDGEPAGRGDAE